VVQNWRAPGAIAGSNPDSVQQMSDCMSKFQTSHWGSLAGAYGVLVSVVSQGAAERCMRLAASLASRGREEHVVSNPSRFARAGGQVEGFREAAPNRGCDRSVPLPVRDVAGVTGNSSTPISSRPKGCRPVQSGSSIRASCRETGSAGFERLRTDRARRELSSARPARKISPAVRDVSGRSRSGTRCIGTNRQPVEKGLPEQSVPYALLQIR